MPDVLILPEAPDSAESFPLTFALDTAADYSFQGPALLCRPDELTAAAEQPAEPDWLSGLEPEPRPEVPSGFVAALAAVLVLLLFNFGSIRRVLRFNLDELVSVRRGRDNVFDERPSVFSADLVLVVLFILCSGFLLCVTQAQRLGICDVTPAMMAWSTMLTAAYYITELVAYWLVGFTFSTDEGRREWVRGYNASVSLLALALVLPALVGLFYAGAVGAMAVVALILFLASKIMFILKGFRIFFDNLFSLLYFILYLCTLEIIPIILVYNCSVFLML